MIRGWLGYSHTFAAVLALSRSAVYKRMKAGAGGHVGSQPPDFPESASRANCTSGMSIQRSSAQREFYLKMTKIQRSRPIKERFQQTE
jgi:hypothetical protein